MRLQTYLETNHAPLRFVLKTSIRPKASQALCTAASMVAPLDVTSSSRANARRIPSELMWLQRDFSLSIRRAAAMMLQPALAKSRHQSRPIPEDAPVTITTFPLSTMCSVRSKTSTLPLQLRCLLHRRVYGDFKSPILHKNLMMPLRQYCKLPVGVSKEELLREGLQPELMPKHVAIIPDGNRRWAKERGLSPEKGHEAGKKVLADLCRYCSKWGVKVLSAYAFSTENWSRPKAEVTFLMTSYFERLTEEFMRFGMKMSIIGDRTNLPNSLKEMIKLAEESTKDNTGLHFVAALNYGGRYDITQATKKIASKVKDGVIQLEDVNDKLIDQELETNKILEYPNPDLLIRTSGELRISNYMLWQLAYSEFYFVDKLFPQLDEADFVAALRSFQQRQRRYGGHKI